MKDYKRKHPVQFRDTGMEQAAGGMGGGGSGQEQAVGSGRRSTSLTEKFNREAKKQKQEKQKANSITTKKQIEILEKMRSQPRPDYGRFTLGSVNNSFDRNRDRTLGHQIKEKQDALDQKKGIDKEFNQAAKKTTLTREFNKQSLGRGMGM